MGRPQFQRNVDVGVFTAESYEWNLSSLTDTLLPATTVNVDFIPAANVIAMLETLFIYIPGQPGAVGTHEVTLLQMNTAGGSTVMKATATAVTTFEFEMWFWKWSVSSGTPTNRADMTAALRNLYFDTSNYLRLSYYWAGDISKTTPRKVGVGHVQRRVSQ